MSHPRIKRNKRIDPDAVLARIAQEGIATLLTVGEAVALIASRTMDSRDDERMARNRVRLRIHRAINADSGVSDPLEDGTCLVRRKDGRINIGELIRWAKLLDPGAFNDLPCKARHIDFRCVERFRFGDQTDSVGVPAKPEHKNKMILDQHAEIVRLKEELAIAKWARKKS